MIGHLIYSYNHLDDARIQQEISKKLYANHFGGVNLVHAHNGGKTFGYKKYSEDRLITLENRGHFQGASDLINAGLEYFSGNKIPMLKYVLVTAADTWVLNTQFLKSIFEDMQKDKKVLAASSWGKAKAPDKATGFSTDFFILDVEWNRKSKLFPIDYDGFSNKFKDLFDLQYTIPTIEASVQYNFQKYFSDHFKDNDIWLKRNAALRRIVEREPVHKLNGERQENWPRLGLYTAPHPSEKQKILRRLKLDIGKFSHKLITSKNPSYYNQMTTA